MDRGNPRRLIYRHHPGEEVLGTPEGPAAMCGLHGESEHKDRNEFCLVMGKCLKFKMIFKCVRTRPPR